MANKEHVKMLERGIDAWNQWREANPRIRPDLREAYLAGMDLTEADFAGADLDGIDLDGVRRP